MFTFVDNHDVNRIASTLTNKNHLPLIFGLMYGMPGIPCVYYGSEWGAEGVKSNGSDADLRKSYEKPESNELTKLIGRLSEVRKNEKALQYGDYTMLVLTNHQYVFSRCVDDEKVIVAINAADYPFTANFEAVYEITTDRISGEEHDFTKENELKPYSVSFWKCK